MPETAAIADRLYFLMLRTLCLCLLAVPLLAQTEPPKPGQVRGSVVSITGEPLRKAEVTLRSMGGRGGRGGPGPGMMYGGETQGVFTQQTDPTGSFAFTGVPPGTYSMTVQRNGYVRTEYGARLGSRGASSIVVEAGATVSGVTVKLTPHGVVAGKVTDEDGDPMAHTSVQVLRERWIGGKRQMVPLNADSTNDLGEYRLSGLMPGRYFVMVNYSRQDAMSTPRPVNQGSDFGYAPLYYPGSLEMSQAAPVTLAPGQELRGIDFQMRKVATFRVRGRIVDESGAPAQQVGVMATPVDAAYVGVRGMGVVRGPDGAFEMPGMLPGSYTLMANQMGRGQSRSFARTQVQVGTRDVDNVSLVLQKTFEINGSVKLPEGVKPVGSRVMLEPLEPGMPFGGGGSAGMEANGAWKVEGLSSGKYRVFVSSLPEGTWLKSVSVQGQDITAGAMISAAASGIEITIGGDAPEVSGTVTSKEKEPVASAAVVLVPEASRRDQHWLFRNTTSDQSGAFTLKNIPPGTYTVLAFGPDVEEGSWFSPDLLRQVESKGVKVKLEERGRETVALTLAQ